MKLTKKQVFAAADELIASHKKPTLDAVRKLVGRGSYGTISDLMSEWRAQKQVQQSPVREPVPSHITDQLAEIGAGLWASALSHASARFETERKSLEEDRDRFEERMKEALALAELLTQELDESRVEVASFQKQIRELEKALKEVDEQLDQSRTLASESDVVVTELRASVKNLNAELVRVNAQNAELIRRVGSEQKSS